MKQLFILALMSLPCAVFAQQTISSDVAIQLINENKKLQIVDVRTKPEFDSTYIKNAINIDFRNPSFKDNIQILDKNKPVLVYCRSGRRSEMAMNIMLQMGFNTVYNLRGGMLIFGKEHSDYTQK